jgi:hypothetical protein
MTGSSPSSTTRRRRRIADGTPPYAGRFKPDEPLSAFDGSKVKGIWTFNSLDFEGGADHTINCIELEIKYKKKRRR